MDFLYKNLNRYLREEDWTHLACLLPYAFCLCKAFLCSELAYSYNKPKNLPMNDGEDDKITLYRGALFDEISLSMYSLKEMSNFSWNAATSTSTNRKVAEDFMYTNADVKKIPVMFVIEVPLSLVKTESLNLIDIKSFSLFPKEDEIVLAPGSIFEVKNFSQTNKGAEIQLNLVTNMSNIMHKGQIMHGTMHNDSILGRAYRMSCLEGKELDEAICYLRGNQLIEELRLSSCKYDAQTLESMMEVLPTIPKLTKLVLSHLSSKDKTHLNIIAKALRRSKIREIEVSDSQLEDQLGISFAQGIKQLALVTTLYLSFAECKKITNKRLKSLCSEGIRYLTSLTTLHLNFAWCHNITDEGLRNLSSEGIRHLTSLTTLNLNFAWCHNITDEGLKNLSSEGIRHLTSLTTLHLNFAWCRNITDEGLKNLSCEGIRHLTSLTTLHLHFTGCLNITDEGLKNLCSEGIRDLTSLTTLHLNFERCDNITDVEWKEVKLQAEVLKISLVLNDLIFIESSQPQRCLFSRKSQNQCSSEIKDNIAISSMNFETQESFGKLLRYNQIKDEKVKNLSSEEIRHLTSLTTLHLNFAWCHNITDEGVEESEL